MNFGCSLSNATVDPTEKSTTRPATASAAGSQKRRTRRTRASGSVRSPASSHTASTVTPCLRPALMSSRYTAELMSAIPGTAPASAMNAAAGLPSDGRSTKAAPMSPSEPPTSDHVSR